MNQTAQWYFDNSNGNATAKYMRELEACGVDGYLARLLFKACKTSYRAKRYRGRHADGKRFSKLAYENKNQALSDICTLLIHLEAEAWGWGIDHHQPVYPNVLYVDLPNGQVSFHNVHRLAGPDYPCKWDRKNMTVARVLEYCDNVIKETFE